MPVTHRAWIAALFAPRTTISSSIVAPLSSAEIHGPSYCSEWNVGQVLSHLGSGAEIGLANLNAALAGEEAPTREYYQSVWARWDALDPDEMAKQSLVSDAAHVERFEGLDDEALDALRRDGRWAASSMPPVSSRCASTNTPCTPGTWQRCATRERPCCPRPSSCSSIASGTASAAWRAVDKPKAAPTSPRSRIATSGFRSRRQARPRGGRAPSSTLEIPTEALTRTVRASRRGALGGR